MKIKSCKIAAILSAICTLFFGVTIAAARTSLNGIAMVEYNKFDAEGDGMRSVSGNTLAQKYSIAWNATNLIFRDQPRYYSLMAGYDWTEFSTKVTTAGVERELKDSYGKLRYNGAIGYSPAALPIRFTAYMVDDVLTHYRYHISENTLLDDGLISDFEGRGKFASRGFTLDYYPERAFVESLAGLPRMHLDYREYRFKGEDRLSNSDGLTREFVAAFSKGNNWLNYRSYQIENYLGVKTKSEHNQVQIGHVDYMGRRKWSALTNWIDVSADGRLATNPGADNEINSEEYDINFQAVASRKNWQARTFMNYNRLKEEAKLTEEVRLPLYVNGVWGADTNWYVSASAERGRQTESFLSPLEKSYSNNIKVGGTLFRRADFTVSPSLQLRIGHGYGNYGKDAYEAVATVETASTSRFSNKLFVAAGYVLKTMDDGAGIDEGTTWSNRIYLKGKYQPSKRFVYELTESIDAGNGSGNLGQVRASYADRAAGVNSYLRSETTASAGYIGSAAFKADLSASYDITMISGMPNNEYYSLNSNASYSRENTDFYVRMRYAQRDNGIDPVVALFTISSQLLYRPNRYHDASVNYSLDKEINTGLDRTKETLLQRYTYNYFTRTGVVRNSASITQEFSYKNEDYIKSKYLYLLGRYSPTSRLSLNGWVKYESNPDSVIMYYGAGLAGDFNLLSASLNYALAKRDTDNRTEKKLGATVTRSF